MRIDPRGLILIVLGVALLLCMRDAASVHHETEPKLFRLNHPRTSRRFPSLPNFLGVVSARLVFLVGTLVGTGARKRLTPRSVAGGKGCGRK